MVNSEKSDRTPGTEQDAGDGFSSEKREDVWALVIAALVLLISVAFPDAVQHFFSKTLYLF